MRQTSVTYTFKVEFTDYVELDEPLYTEEEAREVLWQILYRGDKHMPFVLDIVD